MKRILTVGQWKNLRSDVRAPREAVEASVKVDVHIIDGYQNGPRVLHQLVKPVSFSIGR